MLVVCVLLMAYQCPFKEAVSSYSILKLKRNGMFYLIGYLLIWARQINDNPRQADELNGMNEVVQLGYFLGRAHW